MGRLRLCRSVVPPEYGEWHDGLAAHRDEGRTVELVVGSRIPFGNRWARITHVVDQGAYAVLEGEATGVFLPRACCTPAAVEAVARRVRTAQRQRTWKEATFRLGRKRALRPACAAPRRQRQRERRPGGAPRRSVGAQRDGPLAQDDDPRPRPVTPLRGFWPASVRMVQHLERRRAKAGAA